MALDELSEAKKKALKARIGVLTQGGKSYRQAYRAILKEFNVKLTLPKKGEAKIQRGEQYEKLA